MTDTYHQTPDRIIFHIDVNSAFLSWSALERLKTGDPLDIRTVPSIVGGDRSTRHGIVLAKSIPAKAFGIHTAEPVASALKKCPNLLIVPPEHGRYREYSQQMMMFLHGYTSDIEQVSVDECYLDFGPIAHRFDSPIEAAQEIKDRIYESMGFTVNVGISNCKILAKMASDFEKPNKIHTLWPEEVPAKMWPLPVEELHMVGRASAARLHALGIHTIGDLARTDVNFLTTHFHSHGQLMWDFAHGIDPRSVDTQEREASSVGNSVTLSSDCTDATEALQILRNLCDKVAGRLRRYGQMAQTVQVDIKYSNFRRVSHQAPLLSPTDTSVTLYQSVSRLFLERWDHQPIRLLGVSTSHLVNPGDPFQMSLFDLDPEEVKPPFHTGRIPSSKEKESPAANATSTSEQAPLPPSTGSDNPSICKEEKTNPAKDEASAAPSPIRKPASSGAQRSVSPAKQRKLEQALDNIRSRYGEDSVQRGWNILKDK